MRRVKRNTLKRYDIPQQSPVEKRSHAPGEWVDVEGLRYNPKTKWWDGVPEDTIPYVVMDSVVPGFRWHLAPLTAAGLVCSCKNRKKRGLPLSAHAADCDKDPTNYAVLVELVENFEKER